MTTCLDNAIILSIPLPPSSTPSNAVLPILTNLHHTLTTSTTSHEIKVISMVHLFIINMTPLTPSRVMMMMFVTDIIIPFEFLCFCALVLTWWRCFGRRPHNVTRSEL